MTINTIDEAFDTVSARDGYAVDRFGISAEREPLDGNDASQLLRAARLLAVEVKRLRADLQAAGEIALARKRQLDRLRVLVASAGHDALNLSEDLARAATEP
jgi:hypothetical protein